MVLKILSNAIMFSIGTTSYYLTNNDDEIFNYICYKIDNDDNGNILFLSKSKIFFDNDIFNATKYIATSNGASLEDFKKSLSATVDSTTKEELIFNILNSDNIIELINTVNDLNLEKISTSKKCEEKNKIDLNEQCEKKNREDILDLSKKKTLKKRTHYQTSGEQINEADGKEILKLWETKMTAKEIMKLFPKYSLSAIYGYCERNCGYVKIGYEKELVNQIKSFNGEKTIKEICKILNIDRNRVQRICAKCNIPYKKERILHFDEIDITDKIKSFNGEKTIKEMCKILNVNRQRVYHICDKYNIPYKKERIRRFDKTIGKIKSFNGEKTINEICEILNEDKNYIRHICNKRNIPYKKERIRRFDKTIDKIKSFNGEKTINEICEILNEDKNYIRNIVTRHNIPYKKVKFN